MPKYKQGDRKSFGSGIYGRWSGKLNGWIYPVQYVWHDPRKGKGRRITETVTPDSDGKCRLESAKRLKAIREKEKRIPGWMPPHIKAEREREQAIEEQDQRRSLLFEVASKRFVKEEQLPKEVEYQFNRMTPAFKGRYLDEITRLDVKRYYQDRLDNTGPFADRTREVGLRAPQAEICGLSRLYTFLQDDGHDNLNNPCHKPRKLVIDGKRTKVTYRPERVPVIPSAEGARAILDATESPVFRALFALCRYTGGRPESEPCRLRHGDVELPEPGRVVGMDGRPALGRVHFRYTKTEVTRWVPLHPVAQEALEAVMEPRPEGGEALERWKALPIFRKRGSKEPMDRNSYKKAWAAALRVAAETHPEVEGMWAREFRKTFKTELLNAQANPLAVKIMMGHSLSVDEGYYELTDDVADATILLLDAGEITAPSTAVQGVHGGTSRMDPTQQTLENAG